MKRSVLFVLVIALTLILCPIVKAEGGSAVLMVADTLELTFQSDCHKRLPMASTTKIMTAIVAIENSTDLSEKVIVPKSACGIEGSSIYLYEGETLSLECLLYGLLLDSGNDAAMAIAIHIGGSVDGFVELMNGKVAELGLCNTHFDNPHGLHSEDHYTSAYDLAIIMRYCLQNEDFVRISGCRSITLDTYDQNKRFFSNHNKLLRYYEHTLCGKTGFTRDSGRCLITAAEKDGVVLICATLGIGDDFNYHKSLYESHFPSYDLYCVSVGETLTLDVAGGEFNTLSAAETEPVYFPLKSSSDLEKINIRVNTEPIIYAPVDEGQTIGTIEYYYDGKMVLVKNLIATESIEVQRKENIFTRFFNFIRSIFK